MINLQDHLVQRAFGCPKRLENTRLCSFLQISAFLAYRAYLLGECFFTLLKAGFASLERRTTITAHLDSIASILPFMVEL